MIKAYAPERRTTTDSSLNRQRGGIAKEKKIKSCLTYTYPDTLQQAPSGIDRGRERARERKLDRWRGLLMEGEGEVWRSQGWIVFLFLSPARRLKASG